MFNKTHSKKLYYITWALNTILLAYLLYYLTIHSHHS